jgi:signal transduction histidine kinase
MTMRERQLTARHPTLDRAWLWGTVGPAILQVAVGWPILAAVHGIPVLAAMVASVGLAAALVLTSQRPRLGIAVGAAAALFTTLSVGHGDPLWPWPVPTLIWYVLLVLLATIRAGWRMGFAAWLAGALVSALCLALEPAEYRDGLGNTLLVAALTASALAIGGGLRQLIASREQLAHERGLTAEEESKRKELQQRNRIAQELHDVVAHSMSVISVQATTAPYRLPGMDEPTRGEFSSIAESSRRALAEMRGLLAVLRGDDAAETAPQPTIADIPQLVGSTRASGAVVELEIDPELLPRAGAAHAAGDWSAVVPPATGLTAYRTVQEAVSNALRHAPGAPIRVQVTVGDQIGVRVANGPATRTLAAPAPGAGLGLKGIHERVSALGGTVKAGPTPDGGFTVKARLPL